MGTVDWILLAILSMWLITSVIYMVKRKKKGKSITCGGDCSKCTGCCNSKK